MSIHSSPDIHSAEIRSGVVRLSPAAADRTPLALAAVCIAFFMVLLDGSALNVALPSIRADLHGTLASMQWTVNAYTVPLAAVLLSGGAMGDRWGARRVFAWGLVAFTVASLVCSLSPNLALLVAARAVQGAAAAAVLPSTLTIIARSYADTVERSRAITVWGATGASGLIVGPLLGGFLTVDFGWRSIFLINVPVGLATVALALLFVRETPANPNRHFDLAGQASVTLAVAALVAGLIQGGAAGWASASTLVLLAAAVVLGALFVAVELRTGEPVLPLGMFARGAFTAAISNGFAFQLGGYGVQFMLAVYLQTRWHESALATGLYFVPFAVAWVFGTIVPARRLVHRGPRWLLWTGATVSLAGTLPLLALAGPRSLPLLLAGTTLIGFGCGVFSPSLNAAVFLAVEPAQSGLASGVLNSARQLGMAIGVALLGAFLALPDVELGMRIDLLIVAACFASIVLLSRRWVRSNA
jgi:EmrB/QacA subfamily drug resistance transporter